MRDEFGTNESAMADYAPALESLFAESSDAVLLIDRDGRVAAANPAARAALETSGLSRDWASLWSDDTAGSLAAALDGTITRFSAHGAAGGYFDVVLSPAQPAHALCVARNISSEREAWETQEIMAQELRHRLRNAYAISAAIASASGREAAAHKDFAASLAQRFSSLSVVQSLTGDGTAGEKLDALVSALIQAYDPDRSRIAVSPVPSIVLDEQQARLIGLAIGELCTNSLRHGALGSSGEIGLALLLNDGVLTLVWEEGLALAVDPSTIGQGSGFGLLRRMAQVHRGAFTANFEGKHLRAQLTVPHTS